MRWPTILVSALFVAIFGALVYALDPPHDSTNTIDCASCHTPHKAPGGAITKFQGNANLCQSCHVTGGPATNKPFAEADQALPWPGLPSGTNPTGTSHRWDSGASGHVKADGANTSTGKVQSGGTFNGRYAKTYTITMTAGGDVGTAQFSWTDTLGGSGTGTTGTNVALNEGITSTFTNGTSPSFIAGDRWRIYVRTDINQPTTAAMAARISDGKIMCSTCHNQHSQAAMPFDPNAPVYLGSGTGAGRHYQRVDSDTNQMCKDCHSARDVTLSSQGSHPVGISIPGTGYYKSPTSLPLDKTTSKVQCMSCHQPHFAPTNDGTLARMTNITSLCADCHTLADTTTPAAHLNATTGVLWPGGQYGSTFPQITDTSKKGFCTNCHQPHGWPDAAAPSQDYPKLLVDRQENLCFTCHDGSPAPETPSIYSRFNPAKVYTGIANQGKGAKINQRHDITAADQAYSGGAVECTNCHNPHRNSESYDFVSKSKVSNPDDLSKNFVTKYSPANTYGGQSYRSAATDLNPTAPMGGTGAWAAGYPDMVAFCLACHDGTTPPGVTMSPNMINIANAYFSQDQHGRIAGSTGTKINNGYLKQPWTDLATYNLGRDPPNPYAALPCNFCHEGHGSDNLFQLRTSITIDGFQMTLGSKSGSFSGISGSTYTLPVISGTQSDHYWGAWCTFCHDMSAHPGKTETSECQTGHMHGGGNF